MTFGGDQVGVDSRLVAGRYRLQRRIGQGAMGVVWQALDERLGRVVVVKQLLLGPGLTGTEAEQARQRAMREGRIAARLHHPNAITVYDVTDDDGQPVLVMEYLPSRSLATALTERGTLPPAQVADIGAQAAAALTAAHEAGIVHRDVKPGNILLGDDGTVKITDYGISRATGDVRVTSTGLLTGTPAYMSPEAARGLEPTSASDVFSLGSTLYAAVEGRPPFGLLDNQIAMLHTVAAGRVAPPVQAGPLTGALMRMLHADPAQRPTMAEVRDELRSVTAGRPSPPPTLVDAPVVPSGPAQPVGPPRSAGPPRPAAPTRSAGPFGPTPPRPVNPSRPVGRRRVGYLLAALALVAAVLVGALVANLLPDRDGTGSTVNPGAQTTGPAAEPTTREPAGAVDAARLERAVTEYYAMVPEDTDQGWTRLGPSLQARGRDQYERFWKSVEDLRVVAPPVVTGEQARVELEFTVDKRGRFREVHLLTFVVRDGTPLINDDEVVSSVQIGDDDNKGEG